MNQTVAIFLDAYRELNARKMFWVSLIISGLVIGLFALVGADDNKITFLTLEFPFPMARSLYKSLLSLVLVTIWMTWGAGVLALISTTSIFPDFIAGGSIDLYLSRPIGRLRLFLTKYAAALLFVVLQSAVFSACAYLMMGLRSGEWKSSMFLAIPLLTVHFSYLFCVCVLLGLVTRSSIAALLLTILFWFALLGAHWSETLVMLFKFQHQEMAEIQEQIVADADAQIADVREKGSALNMFGMQESSLKNKREQASRRMSDARSWAESLEKWHSVIYTVKTALPKTSETVGLLDRKLFESNELEALEETRQERQRNRRRARVGDNEASHQMRVEQYSRLEVQRESLTRSPTWILGTSLGFEAVILGLSAWIFCRRDF